MTDIAFRTEAKEKLELVLCPHCMNYYPAKQFLIADSEKKKWTHGHYYFVGGYHARCEGCRAALNGMGE